MARNFCWRMHPRKCPSLNSHLEPKHVRKNIGRTRDTISWKCREEEKEGKRDPFPQVRREFHFHGNRKSAFRPGM